MTRSVYTGTVRETARQTARRVRPSRLSLRIFAFLQDLYETTAHESGARNAYMHLDE